MAVWCRCGELRKAKEVCPNCGANRKQSKPTAYGSRWDKFSRQVRQDRPYCEDCLKEGRTTPSGEVHHIVPVVERPDLLLEPSNVVALCRYHHEHREGRELNYPLRRRGRKDNRGGVLDLEGKWPASDPDASDQADETQDQADQDDDPAAPGGVSER